jgi:type IV secretory pathway TrbD component
MDLKNPRLIYLKGFLFGAILLMACAVIIMLTRDWLIAAMLALIIWSSARGYYFMFYVIEKYVDPSYRFAGILDFLKYLARR